MDGAKFNRNGTVGIFETTEDGSIFTFERGEPHANVVPVSELPCVYIADIGGVKSSRYFWEKDFTHGKILKPYKSFKLKNTSAILYSCILSVFEQDDKFSVELWKKNVNLTLPKLNPYANKSRISSGISYALRSLVALKYIYSYDDGTIEISNRIKPKGVYSVYVECKKWIAKNETGVSIAGRKPHEVTKTEDVKAKEPTQETMPGLDEKGSTPIATNKMHSKQKFTKVLEENITTQDLLDCSAGEMELIATVGGNLCLIRNTPILIDSGRYFCEIKFGDNEPVEMCVDGLYKDIKAAWLSIQK